MRLTGNRCKHKYHFDCKVELDRGVASQQQATPPSMQDPDIQQGVACLLILAKIDVKQLGRLVVDLVLLQETDPFLGIEALLDLANWFGLCILIPGKAQHKKTGSSTLAVEFCRN